MEWRRDQIWRGAAAMFVFANMLGFVFLGRVSMGVGGLSMTRQCAASAISDNECDRRRYSSLFCLLKTSSDHNYEDGGPARAMAIRMRRVHRVPEFSIVGLWTSVVQVVHHSANANPGSRP